MPILSIFLSYVDGKIILFEEVTPEQRFLRHRDKSFRLSAKNIKFKYQI
jgi:hypothetical protein